MASVVAAGRAKPRRKAPRESQPSTSDPVEIAMATAASGKPLPDAARNVLEKHARLIDCHAELARAQVAELRLRHVGEGVRAALWAVLAVAAAAIVALIVAVVVQASRADALIVQSFRVPPALGARGLTGEVVATQVLDQLAEMQERTPSVRSASTYANNWEDELKIDIPNTGASTSEIWKLLRGWLGKETRISGEVIGAQPGLALTARVGSSPGQRFVSDTGDLDELVRQGAELIFRRTQPYRFAIYMGRTGREDERNSVLNQLTSNDSPVERKWAFSGLSYDLNNRGQFARSVRMAEQALAIDPEMAPAMSNGAFAHSRLGHNQISLDMRRRGLGLIRGNEYDARIAANNRCLLSSDIGHQSRDPALLERAKSCLQAANDIDPEDIIVPLVGGGLIRHDPEPALAFRAQPGDNLSMEEAARINAETRFWGELVKGPSRSLAEALDAFRRASDLPPSVGARALHYRAAAPVMDWPLQAQALAMLGRHGEAQALISTTPLDCYQCVRTRGVVAGARGDAPAAQRWFAEAIRQGPGLPDAYVDQARLLARHRRFAAAERNFARARALAPNWADPLKYRGDALAAQGKRKESLEQYEAALKLAPKWAELRQARARLATR